uniref:Uncharacterized protein n=1 Tax=Timema cristinae TaxID=61476 RepID=A0A7R9D3S3_TIMCR|nr:unnamed protein product [Timema cristinae]
MASKPNSSSIRAGSTLNRTGHVNSVNKSSMTPSTVPSTFKSWKNPHELHGEAANAVISLILVIMVGFVVIMTLFFWRKYKHITLSVPTYQYSRLGQNDVDNDFADLTDHLGGGLSHSSSDDEVRVGTVMGD